MTKQSAIWLESEGDAFYRRNKDKNRYPDPVMEAIEANGIKPERVLEIGCGTGWRLHDLNQKFGCFCYGVDASKVAVAAADEYQTPDVIIWRQTAANMAEDLHVDLVVFGFVLYQIDQEDLFRVVYDADRMLDDGGHIIIHDFFKEPETFEVVEYKHDPRLKTFKMNFASLWLAHPFYTLIDERFGPEQTVVSVLRKKLS